MTGCWGRVLLLEEEHHADQHRDEAGEEYGAVFEGNFGQVMSSWGQECPHSLVDVSRGEVGEVRLRGRGASGRVLDDLGGGGDGTAGVDVFAEPA